MARRLLILAGILLCGHTALAQQSSTQPAGELLAPKLTLSVTTEQAMLIVQTLGQIGCQNVTQLVICHQAAELLREIREQAKAQGR